MRDAVFFVFAAHSSFLVMSHSDLVGLRLVLPRGVTLNQVACLWAALIAASQTSVQEPRFIVIRSLVYLYILFLHGVLWGI